jgi:hypothetical protein
MFRVTSSGSGFPRRVPWVNWAEWREVMRGLLYEGEEHAVRVHALDRVSAWHCRGDVPVAVESTADLSRVVSADREGVRPDRELRLLYSLGMVRFVNGMTDREQKQTHAQSVAFIAKTLGLPQFFVDIRHDATHNKLPSLSMLRESVRLALAWLEQNYWLPQQQIVAARVSHIGEQLLRYKKVQKSHTTASSGRERSSEGVAVVLADIISTVNECDDGVSHLIETLLTTSGQTYLLKIPQKRAVREAIRSTGDGVFQTVSSHWLDVVRACQVHIPVFGICFLHNASELLAGLLQQCEANEHDQDAAWSAELLSRWMECTIPTFCAENPSLSVDIMARTVSYPSARSMRVFSSAMNVLKKELKATLSAESTLSEEHKAEAVGSLRTLMGGSEQTSEAKRGAMRQLRGAIRGVLGDAEYRPSTSPQSRVGKRRFSRLESWLPCALGQVAGERHQLDSKNNNKALCAYTDWVGALDASPSAPGAKRHKTVDKDAQEHTHDAVALSVPSPASLSAPSSSSSSLPTPAPANESAGMYDMLTMF